MHFISQMTFSSWNFDRWDPAELIISTSGRYQPSSECSDRHFLFAWHQTFHFLTSTILWEFQWLPQSLHFFPSNGTSVKHTRMFFSLWYERRVNPTIRASQLLKEVIQDLSFLLVSWAAIFSLHFASMVKREELQSFKVRRTEGKVHASWFGLLLSVE